MCRVWGSGVEGVAIDPQAYPFCKLGYKEFRVFIAGCLCFWFPKPKALLSESPRVLLYAGIGLTKPEPLNLSAKP